MNKETKETTPKERIIVLEKGQTKDVGTLGIACCVSTLFPIMPW